jgi:intraflagellar transport protein 140
MEALQGRIALAERFVHARRIIKSDPAETVKLCNGLLDTPDLDSAIRVGDVFALLVEFSYSQRNLEQAYRYIEKMRARRIILSPFLEQSMVEAVYAAMGVPAPGGEPGEGGGGHDDIGEEIEGGHHGSPGK